MKTLSKPISSPGRSEKFPPPLMRFLRSNVGSRSRGRSRSSPMFYLRTKKSVAGVIQEPSSPKVTCIGQVRVRRSSKSKTKKNTSAAKVDATEDSFRVHSNSNQNKKGENLGVCNNNNNNSNRSSNVSQSEVYIINKYEAQNEENKRENFLDSCSSSSPPKNALLLTRCRSAPYRSSSLGGRFCGSPLKTEDENEVKTEDLQKPKCENVVEMARISEESNKESGKTEKNVEDLKGISGIAVHPLLLTRCKSEPARTGERLLQEPSNFWKQRRLGAVEPCLNYSNS
ncbi:hypothetical protein ACJIZ3_024228 [Penstemon smallii]|uniref:Uncharacterized protein n=1 Tax=Penstemon smallii TaxID=265156 RepID=A0ABD3TS69_9LAMI